MLAIVSMHKDQLTHGVCVARYAEGLWLGKGCQNAGNRQVCASQRN